MLNKKHKWTKLHCKDVLVILFYSVLHNRGQQCPILAFCFIQTFQMRPFLFLFIFSLIYVLLFLQECRLVISASDKMGVQCFLLRAHHSYLLTYTTLVKTVDFLQSLPVVSAGKLKFPFDFSVSVLFSDCVAPGACSRTMNASSCSPRPPLLS